MAADEIALAQHAAQTVAALKLEMGVCAWRDVDAPGRQRRAVRRLVHFGLAEAIEPLHERRVNGEGRCSVTTVGGQFAGNW